MPDTEASLLKRSHGVSDHIVRQRLLEVIPVFRWPRAKSIFDKAQQFCEQTSGECFALCRWSPAKANRRLLLEVLVKSRFELVLIVLL